MNLVLLIALMLLGSCTALPRWFKSPLAMTMAPAGNESHLMEFHGYDCDHCEEMLPLMKRIEKELGVKFSRHLVWEGTNQFDLLQILDTDFGCGGLPFFYNRRTHQAICGATTYKNFRNWAMGRASQVFLPPPPPVKDESEKPKRPGMMYKLRSTLENVKEKGLKQMKGKEEEGQAGELAPQ
ncbi:unnamed protein product [Chrysoparadoxa australica]